MSTLVGHLCRLPENGRKQIEEIVEALPNCNPISVGRPGDVRYMTPSPHPTTPIIV